MHHRIYHTTLNSGGDNYSHKTAETRTSYLQGRSDMNSGSTTTTTLQSPRLTLPEVTTRKQLTKSKSKIHLRKKPSNIAGVSRSSSTSFTTSTTSATQLKASGAKSNSGQNHRFGSFFKKISTELNSFFVKLKTISDDTFISNEIIDDLFEDLDSEDDSFDNIFGRSDRAFTSAEETFIEEFKKHKSLDKMAEFHQHQTAEDVKSSSTVVSKVSCALQDVIRQRSDDSVTRANSPVRKHEVQLEDDEHEETDADEISLQDIDFSVLRKEIEKSHLASTMHPSEIGTLLWDYRRKKWLHCSNPQKVEERIQRLSIDHIPRELYVKIYTNLVEKGRSLKLKRHMNLSDLIDVINMGWIAEEKWERAAKGLP